MLLPLLQQIAGGASLTVLLLQRHLHCLQVVHPGVHQVAVYLALAMEVLFLFQSIQTTDITLMEVKVRVGIHQTTCIGLKRETASQSRPTAIVM